MTQEIIKHESQRPSIVTDSHLEFLDDLRESGVCNMCTESGSRVQFAFDVERSEAKEIVLYWMKTFGKTDR